MAAHLPGRPTRGVRPEPDRRRRRPARAVPRCRSTAAGSARVRRGRHGWRRRDRLVARRDPPRLHGRGRPARGSSSATSRRCGRQGAAGRRRPPTAPAASPGPTGAGTRIGHLDRWSHLFVVDARARRATAPGHRGRLGRVATSRGTRTAGPSPSPPTAARTPDLRPRTTIWAVDVDRRRRRRAARGPRPGRLGRPRRPYSPDGRWVAAIGIARAPSRSTTSARRSSSARPTASAPQPRRPRARPRPAHRPTGSTPT